MREIKFRAWHKPTNQFVRCHPAWNDNLRQYKDLGLLSLTSDGELIFETMYDGFQRLSSSNEVDDFIVQQYTGLKDKNEVEIYEGDIINNHEEYNNKKVVNYDPYRCYFCLIDIDEYLDTLYNGEMFNVAGEGSNFSARLEVIGNIFEGVDK